MTKYVYSDKFPKYDDDENIAFTPGKRYEVLDEWGSFYKYYMVQIKDDNGATRTPLIGDDCCYLDGGHWTVVIEEL